MFMRLAVRALLQIKWFLILLVCKFCELQDTKLPNPTFANRKQKQASRHPDIRRNDNVPRNVKQLTITAQGKE